MTSQSYKNQAAVLIALAEDGSGKGSVLLTKRAEHLAIHSGEVAFPGGKWEHCDSDLRQTALRESHEEVGLDPARVQNIKELPPSFTRQGIRVTPFVGRIDSVDGLQANDDEIHSMFWVPMDFLLQDARTRTDIFIFDGNEYWSPVYRWMDYTIWGFTARVLVDFMNVVWGKSIGRESLAPEIKREV